MGAKAKMGGAAIVVFCMSFTSPNPGFEGFGEFECEREVSFGSSSICLPAILGMNECYEHPAVREIADATNYGTNTFLGCYLQEDQFESLKLEGAVELDQFVRIYAMTELRDVRISNDHLTQLIDVMKSNYLQESWSRLEEEIERQYSQWDFDRPVLLEDYRLNESAYTFVLLSKFQDSRLSEPVIQLQFGNMAVVDERLIWFTYHVNFDGIQGVNQARAENDHFAMRFLDANQ